MSLIIIDDKYYKAAIQSLKSKLNTDKKFNYQDFPVAVDNIPSSADGTDEPITGIYFLNPDENGYPTKIKVSGWSLENKETKFPIIFSDKIFRKVESVEFLNCDFKYFNANAFQYMQKLRNIVVPHSALGISNYSFYGCISLTSITIPNSVMSIGSNAFYGCISLTSITIPNSVMSIGSNAFGECRDLEFVELGQGFNANNLDLSVSTKYSRETVVNMFKALYDRTGLTAYTLTLNRAVGNKLTDDDKAIATVKNWTIVYK